MMDLLQAVVLGLVQGVTEWLPVSSSGHLVLVQHYFGLSVPVFFDVVLHLGTLLVVFLVFWNDILDMVRSLLRRDFRSPGGRMALLILVGSVPTAVIGFVFHDLLASFFSRPEVVGVALLCTGLVLYFSERNPGGRSLGYRDSLLIGFAQGLAIVPGLSRSGLTISTGLLRGVEKELAARYSFLLMVPAVLGALVLEHAQVGLPSEIDYTALLVATLTAVVVGYLSLKTLLRFVREQRLHLFSYYCWILGLFVLVFSLL